MNVPTPDPESSPLCGADPLARALAALQPAPAGLDTNRLLFLAGRADRDRSVALWQRAFLAQIVLLIAVGGVAAFFAVKLAKFEEGVSHNTPAPLPSSHPAPAPPRPPEAAPMPRDYDGYQAPAFAPRFARTDPPVPAELAEYLRIRHEVLTAGLGLLPDQKPQPAAPLSPLELERYLNLPPGVLTAPSLIRPPRAKPDLPD